VGNHRLPLAGTSLPRKIKKIRASHLLQFPCEPLSTVSGPNSREDGRSTTTGGPLHWNTRPVLRHSVQARRFMAGKSSNHAFGARTAELVEIASALVPEWRGPVAFPIDRRGSVPSSASFARRPREGVFHAAAAPPCSAHSCLLDRAAGAPTCPTLQWALERLGLFVWLRASIVSGGACSPRKPVVQAS
jgi:hypothetical protein